jgi:hypothetical protein
MHALRVSSSSLFSLLAAVYSGWELDHASIWISTRVIVPASCSVPCIYIASLLGNVHGCVSDTYIYSVVAHMVHVLMVKGGRRVRAWHGMEWGRGNLNRDRSDHHRHDRSCVM